jgi:hypothetical protein
MMNFSQLDDDYMGDFDSVYAGIDLLDYDEDDYRDFKDVGPDEFAGYFSE